jgi:hypothetical protein
MQLVNRQGHSVLMPRIYACGGPYAIRLFLPSNLAFHESKQLGWLHSEAASEVKQGVQGGAFLATFQLSDVVPMIARLVGKGILGAPLFLPEPPKYHAEGSLRAGGSSAPGC